MDAIKARFEENYTPEPMSGCWLWHGPALRRGYGRIRVSGRNLLAHRLAYELHCEPVPAGMNVLHKCDTPSCVNPAHLFVGTQRDNVHDMRAKHRGSLLSASDGGGKAGPESQRWRKGKLSDEAVAEIRASNGCTQQQLADRYGVTQSIISKVRRGARLKPASGYVGA